MDNRTPYKTAAELGIEQWEHDGLVALIGPLSRGELGVDMKSACGSVACIGGNVYAKTHASSNIIHQNNYVCYMCSSALRKLYFPTIDQHYCPSVAWDCSSPQAARAIVNFLVTGDPQWDAVMREA